MIDKICPSCKTRLSDFYRTGMLGCERCYDAFREEIDSALEDIQGNNFHVGKHPKLTKTDRELINRYHELLREKERATIEGRFQDIRRLSIEIDMLAEELKERGIK